MNRVRVLFAIARADFLERVRRYAFLVTLAGAAWLGWLVVRGKIVMVFDAYQGEMNGAWAGTLVSVTLTTFVSLVGLWVVKNSVGRDRATRVGEILAATPLSRPMYTLGKFLSNLAVLASIVGVLALAAPVLVLVHGAEGPVAVWATLLPFALIALPALAVVAALAVLFETFRPLSGGLGNVLWFFLWGAMLSVPLAAELPRADMSGLTLVQASAGAAAKAAHPDYKGGMSLTLGVEGLERTKGTFPWPGIEWTPERVAFRLMWLGVALLIALVAALPFDRFDESRRRLRGGASMDTAAKGASSGESGGMRIGTLAGALPPVLAGELRMMLNGLRWWWWVVLGGLVVAGVMTPIAIARGRILPFAWIWPVLVWSAMGAREARDGTEELIFTAPRPLARQLPAVYLAGVAVAVLAGSGVAVNCLVTGSIAALGAWLVGAFFVPALALALGAWSGASKPFEAVYVVLWYLGPLQPVPALDFMGASDLTLAAGVPGFYAAATAALLAAAWAGRLRRLAR